MFSSNKSFSAFDRAQKPFGFVRIDRVLNILLMSDKFKIVQTVVASIKVYVVYLHATFNRTVKCFPHEPVNAFFAVFTIFAQRDRCVPITHAYFYRSVISVAHPCFSRPNRVRCGDASVKKFSDLLKRNSLLKHLFGLRNFAGVKRFGAGDSSNSPQIANLVNSFKINNWFPHFHTLPLFNISVGSVS